MDRRLFLLSGVAGFTDPVSPLLKTAVSSAPEPPVTQSGDPAFDAWAQDFLARAVAAGWPADLLRRELKDLTPDPRVIAADTRQPEFSRPVSDYMRAAVSEQRVDDGRLKAAEFAGPLEAIQARYGVDRQILIGIWGLETGFGSFMGDFDVLRSLASLAAQGRRRAWAEGEVFAALRMIATGRATHAQLVGSWAGAMGHTQFLPSTYVSRAVDGDGDGRADIWTSPTDALASAANLLQHEGWVARQGWAREILLPPGFDYGLTDGPRHTPAEWEALGARRADGGAWSVEDAAAAGTVIVPAGAAGPAFLAFPNHYVIRKYNNSASYALAVGLVADGVAGAPPLRTPWPLEIPLSREQRVTAQTSLNALGFDVGEADGLIGTRTRAALRAWQKARALTADGYLTPALVEQLRSEAAARP